MNYKEGFEMKLINKCELEGNHSFYRQASDAIEDAFKLEKKEKKTFVIFLAEVIVGSGLDI